VRNGARKEVKKTTRMKTANSFSILFFLKKDKASRGLAPLYVRITVNRKFVDISLKRRIKESSWNSKLKKINGADKEAKEVHLLGQSL
jgi:integrase/recombinase XerD